MVSCSAYNTVEQRYGELFFACCLLLQFDKVVRTAKSSRVASLGEREREERASEREILLKSIELAIIIC